MSLLSSSFDKQTDSNELHVEHIELNAKSREHSPTLIFVHGLGGDLQAWKPTIEILQSKLPCTAVCYDLRGHGYSTRFFPSESKNVYVQSAKDLHGVVTQTESESIILVGHSWGGNIIQEYLNTYSHNNILGTILVCSLAQMPLSRFPRLLNTSYRFLRKVNSQNTRWHLKQRTVNDHYSYQHHPDFSVTRIYSDIRAMGFILYIVSWMAAFGWKNHDWHSFDKSENLYIYGKKDWIIWPSTQKKFCEKLKKTHCAIVNSNHNPLINNTEELALLIANHVQEIVDTTPSISQPTR